MKSKRSISLEDARKAVYRVMGINFIELHEEKTFVGFLERNDLIQLWGIEIHHCLVTNPSENAALLYKEVAIQVYKQFESIHKAPKESYNEMEAELLLIFNRSFLQEVVYCNRHSGFKVAVGLRNALHGLITGRKPGLWEQFSSLMQLDELIRLEENLKSEGDIGQVAEVQVQTEVVDLIDMNPCSIVWCAKLDGLEWLGKHLQDELEWIKEKEAWIDFFHPERELLGQVVIVRLHQGKVALLIQMLLAAEKLKRTGTKQIWTHLWPKFRSEGEQPLKKTWSKEAGMIRNNGRSFRNFLKDVTEIKNRLGIEDEDIEFFLGTIAEKWQNNGGKKGTAPLR